MSGAAQGVLLDVTRALRRAGAPPSGIDRVERAYLRHLLDGPAPVWGHMARQVGHSLIPPSGVGALLDLIEGRADWPDGTRDKDRGLAALRRLGARWVPGPMIGRWAWARAHAYVAVSQTGFDAPLLARLARAGLRTVAMIHDTIPLDAPATQTPASRARFAAMLGALSEHADLVIYNSRASRAAAERHLAAMGRVPEAVVAHLGVEPPAPGPCGLEPPPAPYFLALGTIEPRKNIGFLLDIWPQVPGTLVVAGRQGWMVEDLAARLRAGPDRVSWLEGPSDAALGTLMARASGLLLPSLAEGYGLPAAEAAATGMRVLCNDLPVYREFLGDAAVYAPTTSPYQWIATIRAWAAEPGARAPARMPTWAEHFDAVGPGLAR